MKAGVAAVLLSVGLCGCKASSAFTDESSNRYAETVERTLARANAPDELCGVPRNPEGAAVVVALSAETCLGCDEVGFVLRSLQRDASRRQADLIIAVPDTAAPLVCPFLRRERLLGGVTVEGVKRLPWRVTPRTDGYLRYERTASGATMRRSFVRIARELLSDTMSTDVPQK